MRKHIEVLLTESVPHLGERGDIVRVRAGYARNYLIPRGYAIPATEGLKKQYEQVKKLYEQKSLKEREQAMSMKNALEAETFVVHEKTGRDLLLFHALTRHSIAQLLEEKGFHIDRRRINLSRPIKRAGRYEIDIHIFDDIHATMVLEVQPETSNE